VISPWRALAASPSAPGTGSSNPSPSSGESANLRSRFRDDAVRATASKCAGAGCRAQLLMKARRSALSCVGG
jgi:hypothetical protein